MSTRARRIVFALLGAFALAIAAFAVSWRAHRSRVAALDEQLRAELDAYRAANLTETRPVLRGTPRDGEVLAELARAVAHAEEIPSERQPSGFAFGMFVERLRNARGGDPPPFVRELERVHSELAPFVAAVRSACLCERVEPARDLAARASDDPRHRWNVMYVEQGFVLAAERELARSQPLEACRLAADLWRFRHDLARDGPSRTIAFIEVEARTPAAIIAQAAPRLDEAGLAATDAELAILEATLPPFARAVRRDRLLGSIALSRALHDGAAFDDATGVARIPILREIALGNDWATFDAFCRRAEELSASTSPREAIAIAHGPDIGAVASQLVPRVDVGFVRGLEQLRFIRIARVTIACERFRRARGREPASLEELLGRAIGPSEIDPLEDRPFVLSELPSKTAQK